MLARSSGGTVSPRTRPFAVSTASLVLGGDLAAQLGEAPPQVGRNGDEPDPGDERLGDVGHRRARDIAVQLAQGHEEARAHGEHRRQAHDGEREADPDRDAVQHQVAPPGSSAVPGSGGGTSR
jgi:hypothetical protein